MPVPLKPPPQILEHELLHLCGQTRIRTAPLKSTIYEKVTSALRAGKSNLEGNFFTG